MNVSQGNSLLSLWQHSSTAAFISRFFLVMARKLTVSEALESVLQLETSSDDGSEIEEDPTFPLPTSDSDGESHTHSNRDSVCAMNPVDDASTMQVNNSRSGQSTRPPSRSAGKLQIHAYSITTMQL